MVLRTATMHDIYDDYTTPKPSVFSDYGHTDYCTAMLDTMITPPPIPPINVLRAQKLEAFPLLIGVGTALPPLRKGCVVNSEMTKASNK